LHSRDYVCDEIGDLLVALSKCLNAPILIVVEIHGAIHVLTHAAISVPEVVPVHLDPLQELAVRPDLVRAAPLALEMMIVVVILVVVTVIGPRVAILAIDQVVTVTERHVAILVIDRVLIVARVVNLAIVPMAIVVRAVTVLAAIVIGLLAVTDLTHVAIPVVAIVQPEIVVQGPIVVHVVNMVIVPFVVMIHVVILVVAIVIVHRVATLVTARLVTVHPAVISAIDRVLIVVRVVNMVIVPFVVMIHVVILAVAIVIVHHAASSVIDRLVVMTQALTHVVAIVIAPLVAMALVLDVRRAHVVMTVGTVVAAVGRVVKTSLHADQRTKPNVVVKPCAHVAAVKCVKTANKLRCHAKPKPGLMKAELKMKSAMLPKVQCVGHSHRDAPCRRDQKMKTN
jgi:hypothetical protein